jgi:hypothetical protein
MKSIVPKLILSIGLLAACLLPTGAGGQANQGHHRSGIIGQVVGLPTFVTECNVRIVSSDGGKFFADIPTVADLHFAVTLKPGVYTLVPYPVSPVANLFIPAGLPVVVRVEKKDLTELTLVFTPKPQ